VQQKLYLIFAASLAYGVSYQRQPSGQHACLPQAGLIQNQTVFEVSVFPT